MGRAFSVRFACPLTSPMMSALTSCGPCPKEAANFGDQIIPTWRLHDRALMFKALSLSCTPKSRRWFFSRWAMRRTRKLWNKRAKGGLNKFWYIKAIMPEIVTLVISSYKEMSHQMCLSMSRMCSTAGREVKSLAHSFTPKILPSFSRFKEQKTILDPVIFRPRIQSSLLIHQGARVFQDVSHPPHIHFSL